MQFILEQRDRSRKFRRMFVPNRLESPKALVLKIQRWLAINHLTSHHDTGRAPRSRAPRGRRPRVLISLPATGDIYKRKPTCLCSRRRIAPINLPFMTSRSNVPFSRFLSRTSFEHCPIGHEADKHLASRCACPLRVTKEFLGIRCLIVMIAFSLMKSHETLAIESCREKGCC